VGGVELGLDGATGGGIGEDLDVRVLFQTVDTGGVVAVLVGEEDGVDALEGFAGVGEEGGEFAGGEAGIDEDARTFGHEQRGVARAAGTEDAEAHGHIEGRDEARRGGRAKLKRITVRPVERLAYRPFAWLGRLSSGSVLHQIMSFRFPGILERQPSVKFSGASIFLQHLKFYDGRLRKEALDDRGAEAPGTPCATDLNLIEPNVVVAFF
jgi:hypothetical protein